MATAGKIPFLGFKALVKNLVWLGFGASSTSNITDAYLTDFLVVDAVDRVVAVDAVDRWIVVPATDRECLA